MKQLLRFSFLLLALLLSATATAYDFEVDGIYYNRINSSEVEVTFGNNDYTGSVTIPATVTYNGTTCPVTAIGLLAFRYCTGLTSIVIPNSVTMIGDFAFEGCTGLTSIGIPNSVTSIGFNAFYNTGWFNNQPDGLVYAGMVAYRYKGTMPSGTSLTFKEGTSGIANSAFRYCEGLTSIVIPNSVIEIGEEAFKGCTGLTSIDIPNSVTEIGEYAFDNTGWFNNQPDGLVYAGKVAYKYKGTMPNGTSITLREGTVGITCSAFIYCEGLTSIVIPNSVTHIGSKAFSFCTGLTSIVIPNSVTAIGGGTFFNCRGLTSINIPDSVTSIGAEAFADCTGLTSIVIPNSVTKIGNNAFTWCSGLTSIVVENGNPRYDSHNNCNAIIETANNKLILGCKNTIIPNSVTEIGDYAFDGCTGLTDIVIPNSVTSIGFMAFKDCMGLTTIDIPNSVTKIGGDAFTRCAGLTSIIIPNSITSIGDWAFCWCPGLTDVYCYIADLSRVSSGDNQFTLDNGDYSGRTLHVLKGTLDDYQADENWYPYFGQIVEDIFLGDVNGDREVNIADVNVAIDMILGGSGNTSAADVNGDGEINIADINAVIDIILGGTWN